jgi:acyl-CoA reductase-like NAD-dependent aldehyde dehydrogenase
MRSPVCRELGVRLARTVTVAGDGDEVQVVHALENVSAVPVTRGLWDVHQLRGPGVAYVPRRPIGSAFRDGVKAYPAEGDSEGARPDVVRLLDDVAAIDCRRPRWFKFGVDADEGWALGVVATPRAWSVTAGRCRWRRTPRTGTAASSRYNSPTTRTSSSRRTAPSHARARWTRDARRAASRLGVAAWLLTADDVRNIEERGGAHLRSAPSRIGARAQSAGAKRTTSIDRGRSGLRDEEQEGTPMGVAVQLEQSVDRFVKAPVRKMLIGGKWVEAASGKTFASVNPADGSDLAKVAEGDAEDVDRAAKAARKAFDDGKWARMAPGERERLLLKVADLIEKHGTELAQLETLDNGKSLFETTNVDIPQAVATFRYYAGWVNKLTGETNPSDPGYFNFTLREPVGVCGQIIPWNFPLLMAAWKLGPALACGNTVVLKPAEQTPLTALRLGELLLEAGVPEGVITIVPGYGETAGAAIVRHPLIDKVAFTGSTEVGKLIHRETGETLKRVSLELGGKSPNIVFADADVPEAVKGAITGVFFNQGEVCCAGTRLFVQEKLHDEFADALAKAASGMKRGPGLEPGVSGTARVRSSRPRDRLPRHREEGRREAAHRRRAQHGPGHGEGLLREAHRLHRREERHADRAGGDLRPGRIGDAVQGRAGRDLPGEQHVLRPRRRRVDAGRLEGAPRGARAPRWDRVGQLLQRVRRRLAVRRLQAERLRASSRHAPPVRT